jgi:hypothetical protein
LLAAAFAALSLIVVGSAGAASGTCWKRVLADRSDGSLDRAYSAGCYRSALSHLPADMEAYTSAPDDLQRGLLAALAAEPPGPGKPSSTRKVALAAPVTRQVDAPPAVLASELDAAPAARSPIAVAGLAVLAAALVAALAARRIVRSSRRSVSASR